MKLSQSSKERMRNLILSAKFDSEENSIKEQLKQLGDDIYKNIPDINKVSKVPKGWLQEKTYISCSFNGMRDYINFTIARAMPFNSAEKRHDFASDHEFTARFRTIHEAKDNFEQRKKELRQELDRVLTGINTDKQLLKIWPEAIKWLPSNPVFKFPVVQSVDRLKKLLGSDL